MKAIVLALALMTLVATGFAVGPVHAETGEHLRRAPDESTPTHTVLSAIMLDGNLCHIQNALLVNYTDGTTQLYGAGTIDEALKAQLEALPPSNVITFTIPCHTDAQDAPAAHAPGPMQGSGQKPSRCQAIVMQSWHTHLQGSEETFCSEI